MSSTLDAKLGAGGRTRQGLDGSLAGASASLVLEKRGWARGRSAVLGPFSPCSLAPASDAPIGAEEGRGTYYIRSELGAARSFSLDSPKSPEPRLAALPAVAQV